MKRIIGILFAVLIASTANAGLQCDSGWDEWGHYVYNLNCRKVDGPGNVGNHPSVSPDKDRIGEVTSVRKGVDGSIYVKRYGQGTTEYRNIGGEWTSVGRW